MLAGDLADLIKTIDGNDLLVGRDLKNGIGRRVDDRLAGPDVLFAELLDDLGAARGMIAENAGHRRLRNKFIDNAWRKTVWKGRKRLLQNDPGHLPVAGGRVLAVRLERAFSKAADGFADSRDAGERTNIPESQPLKIRQISLRDSRMCPIVSAPASPQFAASGISPIPAESRTIRQIRSNFEDIN